MSRAAALTCVRRRAKVCTVKEWGGHVGITTAQGFLAAWMNQLPET
jgi:hypothetical protein